MSVRELRALVEACRPRPVVHCHRSDQCLLELGSGLLGRQGKCNCLCSRCLGHSVADARDALIAYLHANPVVLDTVEAMEDLGAARDDDGPRDCMALDTALGTVFSLADRLHLGRMVKAL